MWQVDEHRTEQSIDKDELEHALTRLTSCEAAADLFDRTRPVSAGRAPGRLDVMGGIADYSGSTVLQLPLSESVWAFCQLNESRDITVISEITQSFDTTYATQAPRVFHCSVNQIVDYQQTFQTSQKTLQDYFATCLTDMADKTAAHLDQREDQQEDQHEDHQEDTHVDKQRNQQAEHKNAEWAAYIIGVVPVLMQEYDIGLDQGLSLYLFSSVPEAKGVSSSAAVELASMRAITHCLQLDVSAEHQAVLAQRVENTIVGAPCGIMDQMTSSVGKKGQLLRLLCQPHDVLGHITLPKNMALWGIDSGLRHAVSGADYTSVRVATFMGYRIILKLAGIAEPNVPMHKINDSLLNGYLANLTPAQFNKDYLQHLPETLTGKAFLNTYCDHADSVTTIDTERHYAVRTCTAHPVNEHFRVNAFAELLQSLSHTSSAHQDSNKTVSGIASSKIDRTNYDRVSVLEQLGDYMYQSHAGYTACGLNSTGTDELVSMLRDAGPAKQIYGARITGGGSGGTVVVLAGADAGETVHSIATRYRKNSGLGGYVFSNSSSGAYACALQPNAC